MSANSNPIYTIIYELQTLANYPWDSIVSFSLNSQIIIIGESNINYIYVAIESERNKSRHD